MATTQGGIHFPKLGSFKSTEEWADATTQVLQKNFGTPSNQPNIGQLVLYAGNRPPQGVLPATGVPFDTTVYRVLAQQLKSGVTPNVPAPEGLTYGIVAGPF